MDKILKDYAQQNIKQKLDWFSSFKKPREWNDNSNIKVEQQWLKQTADKAEMANKPKTFTNLSPEEINEKIGKKFKKVMGEYGKGKLHSGSKTGPTVTDHDQALAIAFSEQKEADDK